MMTVALVPFSLKESTKFQDFVASGLRPVMKLLRVGAHNACCTYARVNETLPGSSDSCRRKGVEQLAVAHPKPRLSISARRSSLMISSTFCAVPGRGGGADDAVATQPRDCTAVTNKTATS